MEIYFLRHGEAEEKKEGMEDKDRPLTSFGAAAISSVGRSLEKIVDGFDLILASPLLRARQTADIVRNIFGIEDKILESESLLVGTPPSVLLEEIKKQRDVSRLLIVGHQPHLGICISFLTGKSEEEVAIKKGSCGLVRTKNLKEGQGELIWIKEPSDFK